MDTYGLSPEQIKMGLVLFAFGTLSIFFVLSRRKKGAVIDEAKQIKADVIRHAEIVAANPALWATNTINDAKSFWSAVRDVPTVWAAMAFLLYFVFRDIQVWMASQNNTMGVIILVDVSCLFMMLLYTDPGDKNLDKKAKGWTALIQNMSKERSLVLTFIIAASTLTNIWTGYIGAGLDSKNTAVIGGLNDSKLARHKQDIKLNNSSIQTFTSSRNENMKNAKAQNRLANIEGSKVVIRRGRKKRPVCGKICKGYKYEAARFSGLAIHDTEELTKLKKDNTRIQGLIDEMQDNHQTASMEDPEQIVWLGFLVGIVGFAVFSKAEVDLDNHIKVRLQLAGEKLRKNVSPDTISEVISGMSEDVAKTVVRKKHFQVHGVEEIINVNYKKEMPDRPTYRAIESLFVKKEHIKPGQGQELSQADLYSAYQKQEQNAVTATAFNAIVFDAIQYLDVDADETRKVVLNWQVMA